MKCGFLFSHVECANEAVKFLQYIGVRWVVWLAFDWSASAIVKNGRHGAATQKTGSENISILHGALSLLHELWLEARAGRREVRWTSVIVYGNVFGRGCWYLHDYSRMFALQYNTNWALGFRGGRDFRILFGADASEERCLFYYHQRQGADIRHPLKNGETKSNFFPPNPIEFHFHRYSLI